MEPAQCDVACPREDKRNPLVLPVPFDMSLQMFGQPYIVVVQMHMDINALEVQQGGGKVHRAGPAAIPELTAGQPRDALRGIGQVAPEELHGSDVSDLANDIQRPQRTRNRPRS